MNYNEKNTWLIPYCVSLQARLYHQGLTDLSGQPEELGISILAANLAGDFYDSARFNAVLAEKVFRELRNLIENNRIKESALYLMLQYRMIGRTPPDLLCWATANRFVLRLFMEDFLNSYRELVEGGAAL